jgi:alpha-L-fucosidase
MPSSTTLRDVKAHEVPTWWRDAKLGIFVHWTPASVPAFAPVDADMAELMARRDPTAMAWSPYVEWYQNSLRFGGSPVARHHAEVQHGRSYYEFGAEWEAALENWEPDAWAERFAAAGARYVVLVAKHHDGYCLWPTGVENPHRPGWNCHRDVVGQLAEAVRARGLAFGLYYSGGLDWTFNDRPIGTFSDLLLAQPRGPYVAYAEAHVRELIDRYKPSVLWNDISWPAPARRLADLLAAYYRAVPHGAVNDRFMPRSALWRLAGTRPARRLVDRVAARSAAADAGIIPPRPPMFDFRTPEYTVFATPRSRAWECVRGIDRSFGYNAASNEQDFIARDELLWSLVDIVSKGGSLLLNVGPRGEDATIAPAQLARLDWLAEFMSENGAALYGTRPWVHSSAESATCETRYAAARIASATGSSGEPESVSCFVRPVAGSDPVESVTLRQVRAGAGVNVTSAAGRTLRCEDAGAGLTVWLDDPATATAPGVFVLRNVTARGHAEVT